MSQTPLPQGFMPFEDGPAPLPPRKESGLLTAVLTLVLILCLAVLLNESVLKIHHVAVMGNVTVSWEEVVSAAGLDRPVSYFSVNEEKIAAGINAHKLLVFEKLEKEFPDRLTLYVRERQAWAYMQVMGITYKIDNEGMVLERLGSVQPAEDLMTITGFKARDVRVGRTVVPATAEHMDAFLLLMQEIELQGIRREVAELNLSDPDSLYLITVDGYTAHLGDRTDLRAKIGTVRAVVEKLREMGRLGGMLEASRPGEATYTPASP